MICPINNQRPNSKDIQIMHIVSDQYTSIIGNKACHLYHTQLLAPLLVW